MPRAGRNRRAGGRPGAARPVLALVLILLFAPLERSALRAASEPDGSLADDPITIGTLIDGPGRPTAFELRRTFVREIRALVGRDRVLRFPESKSVVSDWTAEGIERDLRALLEDDGVDLVIVVGPLGAAALCCIEDLPKPVIAPLGIDPEAQGFPRDGNTSGVPNLVYLSEPGILVQDLAALQRVAPHETVHILIDPLFREILADLVERTTRLLATAGIRGVPVEVVDSAEHALAAIPPDAEAVYATPLLRMPRDELDALIEGVNARGLPSMSLLGRGEVERGMLAATRDTTDFGRLGRRVAIYVQRVLLGEDPSTFDVRFERPRQLVINMETARRIGVYPEWEVLTQAELLNEDRIAGPRMTLADVVDRAVRANRDLRATERTVRAGAHAVRERRAGWLPQVDANARGVQIDDDRTGLGTAERTLSAGLSLSQVLWSDDLDTSVDVERADQRARSRELESTRLDVAVEAATAFLDVLRARTLLRIERDDLRRVETNLDLAQNRVDVGYSGPSEVYRWEIEQAQGRSAVLAAEQRLESARAALNRVLHRPLEAPLEPVEPDLEKDPELMVGRDRLEPYTGDPWSFRVFREFLTREGLREAPELRRLDAAIEARERSLKNAERAFWNPTVAASASVDRVLDDDGAGSDPTVAPGGLAGVVPNPDDTDWSVAVSASIPVFTGGARRARVRREREALARLIIERDAAAERIELRIRSALFDIASSYTDIDLDRRAADAARRTFELVSDAYSQGQVSIQDLLDAQNVALVTARAAENAVYDFLIDLMELQRATARVEFFHTDADRAAWMDRLERFFEDVRATNGMTGAPR